MKITIMTLVFAAIAIITAAELGFAVGYKAAEERQIHIQHASRPLPVSWSNFGTCGAEALGDNFVRWTCRIEQ